MSTITPNYRTIKDLLQSKKFAIDEFQREYKWEKEQIDELINDLLGKFRGCYQEGDPSKRLPNMKNISLVQLSSVNETARTS